MNERHESIVCLGVTWTSLGWVSSDIFGPTIAIVNCTAELEFTYALTYSAYYTACIALAHGDYSMRTIKVGTLWFGRAGVIIRYKFVCPKHSFSVLCCTATVQY